LGGRQQQQRLWADSLHFPEDANERKKKESKALFTKKSEDSRT
jgi:hypothetical protein